MSVDAYVVIRLPDNSLFSLLGNGSAVPGVVPIASGFAPVSFTGELLRFTFGTGQPRGNWTWLCALTQQGTVNIIGSICEVRFTLN